jgi:hypothetical protein
MRDGQLVHAEHGELRGEDALAAILRMPAGSLQTFALEPVPQTIFKNFQAVLLDQVRQLDERERDSKLPELADGRDADFGELDDGLGDDDTGLRRAPTPESLGRRSTSGERRAVRAHAAKPATLQHVDIACERIVHTLDGALACALIDVGTGAVLGIHNSLGLSVEQGEAMAAATIDLFRGASSSRIESIVRLQASGERGADHAFEGVQLTSKYAHHFSKMLGSGRAVVLLMTSRSTSLGMGWAQVRAAIPIFERLLSAAAG